MSHKTSNYRWDDIAIFLKLWQEGSLAATSVALGVNASTVGRRIDALEDALAVQLFERTPEGVIATLAAEELHPYAEAVQRSHEAFSLARSGLEVEAEGVVKVTGPPGLIDHFIAPLVGEIQKQFPRLCIELDASVGYVDLSRGEADIALRAQRPTRGDLVSAKLGPFRSCVIGAASRFTGAKPIRRLEQLSWIQWSDALAHIPDAQWVGTHLGSESIVLRTGSYNAMLAAARAGVGVLLTSEPFGTLPGLCVVPISKGALKDCAPMPSQDLFLVGHQALRRVPRVAVVWDFLKTHILKI